MPRSNDAWLNDLRAGGQRQAGALADLRALILRGLPYALAGKLSPTHPLFAALLDDVAQETLLRVLDYLDSFEGRAAFTTWVHKIAVRVALGELRHRRWQESPLPDLAPTDEAEAPPREWPDPQPDPAVLVERRDLLARVQRVLAEELTDKQHAAVRLVILHERPIPEAARQLQMTENALYKLIHDARARLKQRLFLEGLTPDLVLAAFAEQVRR
jgi:RNA polymerase sigma-70 factor (ECF subfamily)